MAKSSDIGESHGSKFARRWASLLALILSVCLSSTRNTQARQPRLTVFCSSSLSICGISRSHILPKSEVKLLLFRQEWKASFEMKMLPHQTRHRFVDEMTMPAASRIRVEMVPAAEAVAFVVTVQHTAVPVAKVNVMLTPSVASMQRPRGLHVRSIPAAVNTASVEPPKSFARPSARATVSCIPNPLVVQPARHSCPIESLAITR